MTEIPTQLDVKVASRSSIFISHATPGDNVFATWLGSRLAMAGYDVWCDQQKLIGGEDFWRDIEAELRARVVKFVLVVSSKAFDERGGLRDGIANEVALANMLKKQLKDDYFIIPIRIDETKHSDFSIDFHRLNGVDCVPNWASGFAKLLKVLERDNVPRKHGAAESPLAAWRAVHQQQSRLLADAHEELQSNWLKIEELPEKLHFYEILRPIKSSEPREIAASCLVPCFDHGRLLGCFTGQDTFQAALGAGNPIALRATLVTNDFLRGVTDGLMPLGERDAQNKITSLVRRAWDQTLKNKNLQGYEMANGKIAWWFPENVPEDGQLRYLDFNGKQRRRAVTGVKGKKLTSDGNTVPKYYWHLGFTGKVFLGDLRVIILQPRVIISEDGKTPIQDKVKLNGVRRSLTSMWFNEKWRGLVLGFSAWLADGQECITLPISPAPNEAVVKLAARPMVFQSQISIQSDPVKRETTEAEEARDEQDELHMRLNDPAFILRDEMEETE
ncbi:MAG: toll/interleukin-1 receptor domain-containing protein [Telmatospirillum sp.]|nr:toll/interleukin-1 receptor domain-containing protein [Telmatospirillum sp.]